MCGVIGINSIDYIDPNIIKRLLEQTRIRGLHATGVSFIYNGRIFSEIVPAPSTDFRVLDFKIKSFIAHCRYSTSDLQYNQPIFTEDFSIVHNGVIDQSDPSGWAKKYNMNFRTRNDSEIILNSWVKNKHPLLLDGSMASIILSLKEKSINFFRNEQRPLYYTQNNTTTIIASTYDILKRSGFENITKTLPCVDYKLKDNIITNKLIREPLEDLQ